MQKVGRPRTLLRSVVGEDGRSWGTGHATLAAAEYAVGLYEHRRRRVLAGNLGNIETTKPKDLPVITTL